MIPLKRDWDLTEGDEIQFGGGLKGKQLKKGPIPRLFSWWLLESLENEWCHQYNLIKVERQSG